MLYKLIPCLSREGKKFIVQPNIVQINLFGARNLFVYLILHKLINLAF